MHSLCLAQISEAPFFDTLPPARMYAPQGLTYPRMVAQTLPYQQWPFL